MECGTLRSDLLIPKVLNRTQKHFRLSNSKMPSNTFLYFNDGTYCENKFQYKISFLPSYKFNGYQKFFFFNCDCISGSSDKAAGANLLDINMNFSLIFLKYFLRIKKKNFVTTVSSPCLTKYYCCANILKYIFLSVVNRAYTSLPH